jgi:hypothetical protein
MAKELILPAPIGLQSKWFASSASRKVLRVGRRGSKTRFAFVAAVTGHGPGWEENTPKFEGIAHGGDVVWICPTYTNLSTVLWREEIIPRMGQVPGIALNEQKHDVQIAHGGALLLRSGEPDGIEAVRGTGKNLVGVIVDEAAHMDLRGALLDVILPACLDNQAWLIIMSTTNAGKDGGYDEEGRPMVPSFFNRICAEIRDGKRGPDWEEFTGTAYDNPALSKKAIDELVAEYSPDSIALKQEVYALLLDPGIGRALPNISHRHLIPAFRPNPKEWAFFAALDWGFYHPWVFGAYAIDRDGHIVKIDTLTGRLQLPQEIDAAVRAAGFDPGAVVVHTGGDVWRTRRNDRSRGGGNGPTVAEKLMELGWQLAPANDARVPGLNNFREYVEPPEDEAVSPQFVWMDTPGNRASWNQCKVMTPDPKNPEDVEKVDADSAGRGGDDMYDENRYALMSRPIPLRKATSVWTPDENQDATPWEEAHMPVLSSTAGSMGQLPGDNW